MTSSTVVQGMVFRRDVEGDVRTVNQSKIAIYSCPLEALQTETKGTVLLHTADELKEFSKGEENQMEKVQFLGVLWFPRFLRSCRHALFAL